MENTRRYFNEIKKFIKSPKVRFFFGKIKKRDIHGYCIVTTNPKTPIIVWLDPDKEFLATLVHECQHGAHPEFNERQIKKAERLIMNNAKTKDFLDLLAYFGKNAKFIKYSEEE